MKKIKPDNKIFFDKEFQKDKYKFNLILRNLSSPELELYSDEENYIICRGAKNLPTWIWTKDNFDKSKIDEIEKLINIYISDKEKNKFTCKKELYDLLISRNFENLNREDYFEMGFLICNKTVKPKECNVTISKPLESDRSTLEKYWFNDSQEMEKNPITMEKVKEDVDGFLKSDKFYLLRNENGKIVCMASYSLTENQAKISHVYTPVEERKKGYAENLIYLMTNEILEKGYIPLLYTDYNYIPSNKAYIKVGYKNTGILINFTCSKKSE